MATEREFRSLARRVVAHQEAVDKVARSLPEWAGTPGIVGGRYQPLLVDAVDDQYGRAQRLQFQLAALARELERRANACADYRRALESWRGDMRWWERQVVAHRAAVSAGVPSWHPGPPPAVPRRPFPEAEAG